MNPIMPLVEQYITSHISPEDSLLVDLSRHTHLHSIHPRMLSGHLQGDLLRLLTTLKQPRLALELGTFTGYATICIAQGLPPKGILHTIDINDELQTISQPFIEQSHLQSKIVQHTGSALDILPTFTNPFDLVFLDADKREYPQYYISLFEHNLVHSGTLIIADNTLWSGKVLEPIDHKDTQTQAIEDFNCMVANDNRVQKIILPLRDGISLILVK